MKKKKGGKKRREGERVKLFLSKGRGVDSGVLSCLTLSK
jgi:hypothetical protein